DPRARRAGECHPPGRRAAPTLDAARVPLWRLAGQDAPKRLLVEDPNAELLGLLELRAGLLPGDEEVRLAADRPAGLATGGPNRFLGFLAREPLERAGHDDGLAGERPVSGRGRTDG